MSKNGHIGEMKHTWEKEKWVTLVKKGNAPGKKGKKELS